MRLLFRLVGAVVALLVVVAAGAGLWLGLSPPDLLRVGDGYAAKIVCSNAFLAGRDPAAVLAEDVQAPGNPALKLIRVAIDREQGIVTARILGLFAPNYALYRPGLGCVTVPDGDFAAARASASGEEVETVDSEALWPDGDDVSYDTGGAVQALLADPALQGPGMRAIVVVKDGRILGEAYGDGFDKQMPLLGWSMTKTVNAAIIGRLMLTGRIAFDDDNLLPQWQGDARSKIRLSDLLSMESGLAFNEDYGAVTDVTRMLYLDGDMAAAPASSPQVQPPGTHFHYSTGTAVLLARLWMDRFETPSEAIAYPREALFAPLGMASAVFEADERGTFVGGSYLYASARDWARFGQFLLQDGVWKRQRLLPEGFVGAMRTPTKPSDGAYTQVQAWLHGPGGSVGELGLPSDAFWMLGHDGQSIAIVPSAGIVLVRLGLTPDRLGYRPQQLLRKIIDVAAPPH